MLVIHTVNGNDYPENSEETFFQILYLVIVEKQSDGFTFNFKCQYLL